MAIPSLAVHGWARPLVLDYANDKDLMEGSQLCAYCCPTTIWAVGPPAVVG